MNNTSEVSRKKIALSYGLDESSSWSEINDHCSNNRRKEEARLYGLDESYSWDEINKHKNNLILNKKM